MASFNEEDSNVKSSNWLLNFLTANLAPMNVREPSLRCIEQFNIIKYDVCGKSNNSFGRFKKRYTFLLPGRIVIANKGYWDPDSFMPKIDLNIKPKYIIYLTPYMNVTRDRNILTLKYYLSRFSVPWQSGYLGKELGADLLILEFANVRIAEEWENAVITERDYPKVPKQIINYRKLHYDSNYNSVLHKYLMASALAGNKSLLSLMLNSPENRDYIFSQLHANIRDNFENDPAVLAYTLECISGDVVDRCLLRFIVLPRLDENQVSEIIRSCPKYVKDAVSELPSRVLTPLVILLKSFSEDADVRKALLQLLGHPAATSAKTFHRDNSVAQHQLDWSSELKWFREVVANCGEPLRLKTMEEVMLMSKSPLFLLLKLLENLQNFIRNGSSKEREIFEAIPAHLLSKEFEALDSSGEIVKMGHFVNFFLELSKEERAKSLRNLKDNGVVTDDFFRTLVQKGLKIKGGGNAVFDITKELVFARKEFCEDDFCVSFIEIIPNFAPIIVEEMYDARGDLFQSDPYSCRHVLTFVFRLENCSERGDLFREANIVSITNWISSDPKKKKNRMEMVKCILADLELEKYVLEKLSPLMPFFYPPSSVFAFEAPSMEVLKRSMSDGKGASLSKVYTRDRMADLLIGFMIMSAACNSECFSKLLRMLSPRIFETFLAKCDPFRAQAIAALARVYSFTPSFLSRMRQNEILNDSRHFESGALELMTSSYPGDDDLFAAIATIALRLKDFSDMRNRVDKLIKNLVVSRETKIPEMMRIVDAVTCRTNEELGSIALEDLSLCVNDAVNALALLGLNQVNEKSRLRKLFEHYLKNCKPDAWRESFRGAYSVAIFMKYLSYEDIDKAYEVFSEINKENAKFISFLNDVKGVYRKPLMTETDIDHVMKAGTSEEAIASFLDSLDKRLQNESSSSEERLIAKLGVEWMKKINDIMKVPIAPRNAQFISMLTCCKWARRVCSNLHDRERALVAQVGTGEGKSLIIAMSAIYMVKELGYKVHILENNEGLLRKDHGQFQSFFEKLGVTVVDATRTGDIMEVKDFQVVYTLRHNLESYYREAVFRAIKPFAGTILIVDEVDELIVDDHPNSFYVKAADATALKSAFEALKSGRGKPDSVPSDTWAKALDAQSKARGKKSGIDYRVNANGSVTSLANGKETRYYNLWAEYIAFERCNTPPKYQTLFFCQSMPYMLSQYLAILGLSGSLGSPAEKNYLKSTYGAWNYTVPSFLETCKPLRSGVPNKSPPTLDDGCVRIYRSESEQFRAVVNLAIEKASNVPVLIVAKYLEKNKILDQCKAALSKKDSKWLGSNPASEFVQLFAEVDNNGDRMNWAQIVDKATAGLSGTNSRRITVTDPFGGRGHDFSVRDNHEHVESYGGMLVITTFIPESERDWIQWKGRTARSDNRGQYAVILRESPLDTADPQEQAQSAFLATHKMESYDYKQEVVAALLAVQDKKKEEQIKSDQSNIIKGKRLNELCDNYYLTYETGKAGKWPSCKEDEVLCDFLEKGDHSSLETIREVCQKLNLTYTSKY